MRKNEIIRENQRLKIEIERQRQKIDSLNATISGYKKTLENIRKFYGAKLLELEEERISKLHSDLIVEDIEWFPSDIDQFINASIHRYSFIYGIKGENNYFEIIR